MDETKRNNKVHNTTSQHSRKRSLKNKQSNLEENGHNNQISGRSRARKSIMLGGNSLTDLKKLNGAENILITEKLKINNFLDNEKDIEVSMPVKYRKFSYQLSAKDKIKAFIDHTVYKIIYMIITIYILFADDIKIISTEGKFSDLGFSIIAIVIMVFFFIEIILYFIVYDEDYSCGLYFWVDVIGLASMVLDIHWVTDKLISDSSDNFKKGISNRVLGILRLSRGVRIVTRAIRMVRIIKVMKLFKNINANKNSDQDEDSEELPEHEESKVGKKLEELTLKRMIILILLMIFSNIFFNPNFYYNPKSVMDFGLQIFNDIPKENELFNFTFNIYVKESLDTENPIIYVKVYDLEYGNQTLAADFRTQEKVEVWDTCNQRINFNTIKNKPNINETNAVENIQIVQNECHAIFDNRIPLKFASIMNIVKTIFICIVLGGGIICFSKDTNDLVLEPIAKMTKKIKHLSKNPIAAMQKNLNEKENENENIKKFYQKAIACFSNKKKKQAPLETTILEKTISKISTLLALGFGEAGAEIISTNMQKGGDGDVNPMVSGKKVMAVYGFCDIRNFTDTTEVLQEKVMIFVNEIAEIVHEITSLYCGSANKNIGDAFLLVWKFEEKYVSRSENEVTLMKSQATSQLVDMALIAFLKIIAEVHKSYKLNAYRKHEALCERMPNYCVKMGFGLHLGYAIEGAIGSMFKIDASYLSPNVNMAGKLEEKTKEYKVDLILSDDFVENLSEDARKKVRLIDQIKWECKPDNTLRLYTVDIDLSILPIDKEESTGEFKEEDLNKKMEKIKIIREKRKEKYEEAMSGKKEAWNDFIENDPDWHDMRKFFTDEFYENYDIGVKSYISGDWEQAKQYLDYANSLVNNQDGPIRNFLEYMKKRNYIPDKHWNGVRDEELDGH